MHLCWACSPPSGLALFVVGPIARVSVERLSFAVLPFITAMLVVLTMIAFVPALTVLLSSVAGSLIEVAASV